MLKYKKNTNKSSQFLPVTTDRTKLKDTIVKMVEGKKVGSKHDLAGRPNKNRGQLSQQSMTILTQLAQEKRICKCCRVIQQTAHKCVHGQDSENKASMDPTELPAIDGFQPSTGMPVDEPNSDENQFNDNPLLKFRPFFEDLDDVGKLIKEFKKINIDIIKKIEPIGEVIRKRKSMKTSCKYCKEFLKIISILYEELIRLLIQEQVIAKLDDLDDRFKEYVAK